MASSHDRSNAEPHGYISRRRALGLLGGGIVVAGGAGYIAGDALSGDNPRSRTGDLAEPATVTGQNVTVLGGTVTVVGSEVTVADWISSRGSRYLIAHRGSGDVYPEHSVPGYDAAVQWGAGAMEVSVQMTSDGQLICLHDSSYDRTTNLRGSVRSQPVSVLSAAYVVAPQLGPAWQSPTLTTLLRVPLLEEVMRAYGGRIILCIDPKDDRNFDAVMALVDKYDIRSSVVAKLYADSERFNTARNAGLPVFGYYGRPATAAEIASLAAKLDPQTDYLTVTPTDSTASDDDVAAVRAATTHGLTVWVGPIHRRYEIQRYAAAGAAGFISSNYGYLSGGTPRMTTDSWAQRALASGELTRSPSNNNYPLRWTGDRNLTLSIPKAQQFVTLGNLGPISSTNYSITFDACWDSLPDDPTRFICIAFGHSDDRYYQVGLAGPDGYHAILRANGQLEVFSHLSVNPAPVSLARMTATAPLTAGQWVQLRLQVSARVVTWERLDAGKSWSNVVSRETGAGGYVSLGRNSSDERSSLSLRSLSVTTSG